MSTPKPCSFSGIELCHGYRKAKPAESKLYILSDANLPATHPAASDQQNGTASPVASCPKRVALASSSVNEQHGDLNPVTRGDQASAQEGAL